MALNETERATIVGLEREKAQRFITQADDMYAQGYWDMAINRYYYACFHIVQALFIKTGLSAKTHSGMIHTFGQHFIQSGKVDRQHGVTLTRLFQLRQTADYNCALEITQTDAEQFATAADLFVKTMTDLIER